MTLSNIAATGEPFTDFERGGNKGPFQCSNCTHMDAKEGVCLHPIMEAVSKQPRKNGKPKVDEDDCCKFVRRKGE